MDERRTLDAEGDPAVARAVRRLRLEKGFYIHLAVYAVINGILVFINWRTGSPWWFVWPTLGWGIGLGLHAYATFGLHGATREWERRRLQELVDEERSRS